LRSLFSPLSPFLSLELFLGAPEAKVPTVVLNRVPMSPHPSSQHFSRPPLFYSSGVPRRIFKESPLFFSWFSPEGCLVVAEFSAPRVLLFQLVCGGCRCTSHPICPQLFCPSPSSYPFFFLCLRIADFSPVHVCLL